MHHHHGSIILVQEASKGGRQVGQPVGSGNSCQRGKPERVQRQMDERVYIFQVTGAAQTEAQRVERMTYSFGSSNGLGWIQQ